MKTNIADFGVKEKIIELIRDAERGISVGELSDKLELERHTIAKYLDVLRSNGMVDYKQIGMSKLWFATKSPIMKLVNGEDEISLCFRNVMDAFDMGIAIVDPNMKVVWSNKAMKKFASQSNIVGSECFRAYREKDVICKECPATHTLRKGEKHRNIQVVINENGERDVFELITSPINDYNGEVIAFMESIRKLNEGGEGK